MDKQLSILDKEKAKKALKSTKEVLDEIKTEVEHTFEWLQRRR